MASTVNPLASTLYGSVDKGSSALSRLGNSMAKSMSTLATATARPAFELQFNLLQNQMIERLNKKISEIQAENTISRQLKQIQDDRSRLLRTYKDLETVRSQVAPNVASVREMVAQIEKASKALASDSVLSDAEKQAAVDAAIKQINTLGDGTRRVDGWLVGLNVDDGVTSLRGGGAMRIDGQAVTGFKDIQDFVDSRNADIEIRNEAIRNDPANAGKTQDEINALLEPKLDALSVANSMMVAMTIGGSADDGSLPEGVSTLNVMSINSRVGARADLLVNMISQTQTTVQKLEVQAATMETADLAEKASRVAKIRQEYGYMLQSISLAFEGSQAMAESISQQFFSSGIDKGGLVSLFA